MRRELGRSLVESIRTTGEKFRRSRGETRLNASAVTVYINKDRDSAGDDGIVVGMIYNNMGQNRPAYGDVSK